MIISITSRQLLSADQLGRLPILCTNPRELRDDLMLRLDYNPTCYYPDGVIRPPDEVGHTANARWVVPRKLENTSAA